MLSDMKHYKMSDEEELEVDSMSDEHWENYCGACDNLNKDSCPFYGKVDDLTEWKKLKCKSFDD